MSLDTQNFRNSSPSFQKILNWPHIAFVLSLSAVLAFYALAHAFDGDWGQVALAAGFAGIGVWAAQVMIRARRGP